MEEKARDLHWNSTWTTFTLPSCCSHCDISPSNILLDDNMELKVADFSVSVQGARFMSKPEPIKVDFLGTFVYGSVELQTHDAVTDKSNVYSFAMVLLHVVCGRNFSIAREHWRSLLRLILISKERLHQRVGKSL